MSGIRGVVAAGLALGMLLAVVAVWLGGTAAAPWALLGAAVAVPAQALAVGLLRPVMGGRTPEFMRRWAAGMAVRAASFVVMAVLMVVVRERLPVTWMAAGYLGVLLPLLFVETRFLR